MKKALMTEKAPAPIGPYSQAIEFGSTILLSGQVAINPATGDMVQSNIVEETKQVMENIHAVLRASDLDFSSVVKCSIFLADMNDFANVNTVYGSYFEEPFPARECVEVSRLPKDARVEISVTAYKG